MERDDRGRLGLVSRKSIEVLQAKKIDNNVIMEPQSASEVRSDDSCRIIQVDI